MVEAFEERRIKCIAIGLVTPAFDVQFLKFAEKIARFRERSRLRDDHRPEAPFGCREGMTLSSIIRWSSCCTA